MRLFHFSDRGDIAEFVPRPPERHPDAQPFVYAIDEWHSPNYLFPRNCPRIGVWPIESTSDEDRETFGSLCSGRMKFWIDVSFLDAWEQGSVFRYELDSVQGFVDCQDHGVWVSQQTVTPTSLEHIVDLPCAMQKHQADVEVVPSLIDIAHRFFDFEAKSFTTTLHVSMIRMSLLPNWELAKGKPVTPKVG